jgi:choline-sulfatase
MPVQNTPSFPPANLLLVSFDQWRGDWGDPLAPVLPLPALAGLTSQGWTARRCCTGSPHCVPARLSWITGLAPSQLGITRNRDVDLPPDAPSLVRNLREAGWHTALVGKTHWSSHGRPRDLRDDLPRLRSLGFEQAIEVAGPRALRRIDCALTDAWRRAGVLERQRADLLERYEAGRTPAAWAVRPTLLPTALYPDVWIADQARELLASLPADRPWLLWVSFVGPHEPFDTPPPWHGRHAAAALPPAVPRPAWLERLPQGCELRRAAEGWDGLLSPEAIASCRADYADHLRLLDDQLAGLLAALKQRPDAGRTAVLATADHGELLGDAGMLYKGAFLEGAVRVPWIYRPPGGSPSSACAEPLGLSELLARCLAGLPGGGGVAPLLRWASRRPGAVVEFGEERLFLRGRRKLAVDGAGRPLWAVHLGRDPHEQVEVITMQPDRWRWSPDWRRLRRWAAAETTHRSAPGWLWRQLGPQG